ncbi:MAG: pantoate--beta-alanine ligase [Caldimicrobium sp.]|nr:pantoate--beta-alanine ligase [Caldimicrobium sp.]MCX7873056.1 pantoate--beta-alanine ligase [Caldimicrobium sp.]MDW8094809.1 pantoate--beta-alanine ligase [Caldimicrobium sp.]
MEVVKTKNRMKQISKELKEKGYTIGFVPTMGFLHEGHLQLVRLAKKKADKVVVSIFVNPLQFASGEDYEIYPRDLERDRILLEKEEVDVLFCPDVEELYPPGYQTYVEVTELSQGLCGAFRPGHFRGVATVVLKLFNIIKPNFAIFGEKDYQQLKIIQQMTKDLDLDIEIIPHPIVREEDGLAMSSRNNYLSSEERRSAICLYQTLKFIEMLVHGGEREPQRIKELAIEYIERFPFTKVQYVELVDVDTLQEIKEIKGPFLAALAVYVGKTRLIDNKIIYPKEEKECIESC